MLTVDDHWPILSDRKIASPKPVCGSQALRGAGQSDADFRHGSEPWGYRQQPKQLSELGQARGDEGMGQMGRNGNARSFGMWAVAVLAALSLAACGGSDSADSSTNDAKTSETRVENGSGTANQNQNNSQNQNKQNNQNNTQNQNNAQADSNQQPAFPTIAIVSCSINATSGRLTVTASSSATGGTRGVSSVHVLTYNDEGASVKTDLSPLGPDTGNGDQWSTTRVAYGNGYEKNMTVVAKASTGATKSADFSGPSSPCPS